MKKLKSFALAVIGLLCCGSVSAHDFEVDGIFYNITSEADKTVGVTFSGSSFGSSTDEYSGDIVIPASVIYNGQGYSVNSIEDYTFISCSRLSSVVIPNSVTNIGTGAFEFCEGLTSVVLPDSVTNIGGYAFTGCSGLTSVEIPNSLTCIGEFVFDGCSSLVTVVLPNSVTSIGEYAFGFCSSLASIVIPNSVTSIGTSAFEGCYGLTSVEIPNSVTSIGECAFGNCSGLTFVEIPNSVTSIGGAAFIGCTGLTSIKLSNSLTCIEGSTFSSCLGLTSVNIPNSVTNIGGAAFYGCLNLTSVTIGNGVNIIESGAFYETAWYNNQPDGVVYLDNYLLGYKGSVPTDTFIKIKEGTLLIADNAFSGCAELNSIEIPNSVKSFGVHAFSHCSGLTSVEIPNSVTSIGHSAFYNCSSLTSVVIGNGVTSIGDYAFKDCYGLTSVEMPNSVTSIGDEAFAYCYDLTSVEIGNSVTSIGEDAFYDCYSLKSITSLNPTPPATSYSTFSYYDATLYVPSGAKTAYSEAEYWKNFTNIEELEPSIYELTDGEEYNEASDMTVEAVTYTRTLPNLHWNALYVPFELPYDVIADRYEVAYINDVNGYDTDDNGTIDDLAMEIIKIKGGTLKANYPYLIKAKTEADKDMSITVEDATLYAAEENSVDCSSVYQNYTVTGIYTKKTAEELSGKLAISTSGAWQPLAAGTALNPFRLYLSIENRDNSPLKVETSAMSRMRIVERGETTGVETIIPAQQREDVIIDLSGRRVKQPVKGGVYIVNGKKRIF